MSDRDFSNQGSSGWYRALVAGSLALAALSAVSGSLLSKSLDQGDLSTLAAARSDQSLKRLAKTAPVSRPGQGVGRTPAAAQINGVDTMATAATSPGGDAPCSRESQAVLVVRSVGIDGVRVSSLPSSGALPPCEAGRK